MFTFTVGDVAAGTLTDLHLNSWRQLSCDATKYFRETTQNTRLTLLFSYLTFLFLNVYRANLSLSLSLWASQTGIVLSSLGRATDTKTTTKTETVKRFGGQELFSFFSVCLAERGWPLTGVRDMLSVQRNRERERERGAAAELQTHFKLCVSRWDIFYWKGLSELFDQKWRHGRTGSRPPGPSSEQNKLTLGLGIDPLWFSF